MSVKYVPDCADYLVGLMNIQGQSVPLVDLAIRFGWGGASAYHIDTPVVLCHQGERSLGLIVDEVVGLFNVDNSSLQKDDSLQQQGVWVAGVTGSDTNMPLLLDVEYLMRIDHLSLDALRTDSRVGQPA